jgi:hypothetical protein
MLDYCTALPCRLIVLDDWRGLCLNRRGRSSLRENVFDFATNNSGNLTRDDARCIEQAVIVNTYFRKNRNLTISAASKAIYC